MGRAIEGADRGEAEAGAERRRDDERRMEGLDLEFASACLRKDVGSMFFARSYVGKGRKGMRSES